MRKIIFSILAVLTMAVILTCIFASCDKTDSQDSDYKVTIHPNNGQPDIVWDITTDVPSITKYGYHIVGFYLDEDMTISTTLESLKASELTKNIDVYVKWEKDSVPPKTKISTNKLLCDYGNRTLSGKVSNSTAVFSFNDEISVEKGATYTVSTDITGINVIPSKTVNLEIGDNVFYILVSNDDELTLYTATVRRRPIYTVTFDALGGREVEPQQVEEDDFATAPNTEKNGCTFERWDWNFATPITENTTVTAIWNAFVYNIVYDFNIPEDSVSQEVDNSMNPTTYTVDDSIYFYAPKRKGYYFTGWSVSNVVKGTTGTITTTAQWRPIVYEIIYDFGDANSVSKATNNVSNSWYYCVENEITFAEPTRAGYTFISWDKNIEKGTTGTQTITASWSVNQYNIDYVLNGWTNSENNKATYTIEDQTFALFDGISGESLFCGWYLDDEYTNCIETIDSSLMKDYTVYAKPDFGSTKGLIIENGVVKGYSGTSNEVVIPSFYKGYAVNSLAESSFKDCSILTSVTVPNSVTNIEVGSFFGCLSLESITLPFLGASNTARNGYDQVLGYVFGYKEIVNENSWILSEDTEQYVTSSNKIYTHYLYYIPKSLRKVVISGELAKIPNNAFKNCNGLTNITIPDTVTSIDYEAFYNCSGLVSVTIPDSVTSIGSYAFWRCTALTTITIGSDVTSIGGSAFYGCRGLTSVTIGSSVTSIGDKAFCECYRLVEVYNKSSLTITAGSQNNGYVACYAMNVYIDEDGSKLSTDGDGYVIYTDGAQKVLVDYRGAETELTLPTNITQINQYAFSDCSSLTSVTIPDGVTSIGDSAFSICIGLTSVTIGSGVTSVGSSAFNNCTSLMSIYYIGDVAGWCKISGLANLMSSSRTLYINGNKVEGDLMLSDSVTSIADYAFYYCGDLTSMTIGNGVTSIGDSAFSGCSGLTSVTIGKGVTDIGRSAFSGCEKLTSVTIPNGVTSIGSYVFSDCNGLVSVTIGSGVTSIGWYAFDGCAELTSITIPNSLTSIGWYAFEGCTNLTNIYYNGDVAGWCSILGLANLMNCGADSLWGWNSHKKILYINNELVTSLIIPDSVTSISRSAFQNCSSLTSVTIPNSVTSIGDSAFQKCSGLTSINFKGTKTQWNEIEKGNSWRYGVASNCTINCSDGTI